ncbi:hypothetical protein GCM10010399_63980 [Dactylosporangium fulvum]|uniref:Uncharacterized protein n=1 Tax=Dactylosporangium fulvum TaxID=53359 RepID=A0ABY5W8G6_9ACTN|nr:hypothetical protein [Dactylosporangium fulvum]UWP85779.1 hypothetical protein Dfulv_16665 [Dactylosporangium fulvum]
MSTVDPRRAGDLLPLTCECRSPTHGRGISRCTDRDVECELHRSSDGRIVLKVVEDERRPA